MVNMLEILGSYIIQFIQSTGYAGVFILMTLESALIPIPSEVTMPFAGSLVASGTFNFWLLALVGAAANLTGSLLAYGLGYLGEGAVKKYGKYIFLREQEFEHAQKLFNKYGEAITFLSRILPAIRTYISLPAGIAKMNLKKFILYTTLGSLIWSTFLTYLGVVLGANWHSLSGYFHKFDLIIVVVAALGLGVYLFKRFRR
ncbi:DedA family protein [Candidatus Microgenomates bacterium]|nr:DedA family protein [Candidatus Microgenomates bacterium]